MRSLAFLQGGEFLRFLLTSANAKAALHVPAPACGDCRQQELPFLSSLCSAHRRLFNLPEEEEVISALCLCHAGHPGQSLLATSPLAELYMRKEGRRCCEMTVIAHWRPELAEPLLFPCIYLHLSFQLLYKALLCSQKYTSGKKKEEKNQQQQQQKLASKAAPVVLILAFGSCLSHFHLAIDLGPAHPTARCGNCSKSGERGTWRDHVSALHLILPNSADVKHIFKYIPYLTSLVNHILKNFAKLGFRLSLLCYSNSRTTLLPYLLPASSFSSILMNTHYTSKIQPTDFLLIMTKPFSKLISMFLCTLQSPHRTVPV